MRSVAVVISDIKVQFARVVGWDDDDLRLVTVVDDMGIVDTIRRVDSVSRDRLLWIFQCFVPIIIYPLPYGILGRKIPQKVQVGTVEVFYLFLL